MRYYVKRTRGDGYVGWTGTLPTIARAQAEAQAWRDEGWSTEVLEATRDIRAQVRAWQASKTRAQGRRQS